MNATYQKSKQRIVNFLIIWSVIYWDTQIIIKTDVELKENDTSCNKVLPIEEQLWG